MRTLTQLAACALLSATLFTSCSRQVATYQPMPVEQFARQTPSAPATIQAPEEAPMVAAAPVELPAEAAPLTAAAQMKSVEQQIQEAIVRNDSKLADNKRLAKRMARVQSMLAEAQAKAVAPAAGQSVRKANFLERFAMKKVENMVTKGIDKKIHKTLAPKEAQDSKAVTGLLRVGLIIGIIGLILAFIPGVSWLGVIAIVVGLILILLDLLDVA